MSWQEIGGLYKTMFVRVPGFSHYLIDDKGVLVCTRGGVWYEVSSSLCRKGYVRYTLRRDNGSQVNMKAHRLVMLSFVGHSDLTVDHLDDNKLNNSLSNLEYVTNAENKRRAKVRGKIAKGMTSGLRKLTDIQVLEIAAMRGKGKSQKELAALYNTSAQNIGQIWKGQTWRELLKEHGYEIGPRIRKTVNVY